MPQNTALSTLLDSGENLVLDGALATELEAHGCDLGDALWSAKVLLEQPHLIKQVHRDYFDAGASVAITASYRATPRGFAARTFRGGIAGIGGAERAAGRRGTTRTCRGEPFQRPSSRGRVRGPVRCLPC